MNLLAQYLFNLKVGGKESDEDLEKEKQRIREFAATPTKQKKMRKRQRKDHKYRRKHSMFTEDELLMRRARGSELTMDSMASMASMMHSDQEEATHLENKDLEEMTYLVA